MLAKLLNNTHVIRIANESSDPCAWGTSIECAAPAWLLAATALSAALTLLYVVLYYGSLVTLKLQLRKHAYQDFRLAHQLMRLEV